MITKRTKRLSGFSYVGRHRYFATACCDFRHQAFVTAAVANPVAQQILQAAKHHDFAVITYCLMPDHVHLLVEGTSDASDFCAFMALAKQTSGFWYRQHFERWLWQEGYQDHILRSEEASIAVAAYIVMNPVKAGLVTSPELYPFSGSGTCDMREILEWIQRGYEVWDPDRRP